MTEVDPLFGQLSEHDLDFIAGHGIVRSYPKSSVIVHEGDVGESLYILLEGRVKVFVSDEQHRELTLNIQGPGEYFGELSLIDDTPRSASVVTLEQTRVALVTRPAFERCLAENSALAIKLMGMLVKRIRSLTLNIKNLALLDVYGRVARTLLDLAVEGDGIRVIEHRLTHQEIANMVGASREMVSRIMKDLVMGGYLAVEDGRILIKSRLPARW